MSDRADTSEQAEAPMETFRPNPKMPVSEALVWLCALAGLSVYAVGALFPQLVAR